MAKKLTWDMVQKENYEPQNVNVLDEDGRPIYTYQAVFRVCTLEENTEITNKLRDSMDEDGNEDASIFKESVEAFLVEFKDIPGIPEDMPFEDIMKDMHKDGRHVAAEWHAFKRIHQRQFEGIKPRKSK